VTGLSGADGARRVIFRALSGAGVQQQRGSSAAGRAGLPGVARVRSAMVARSPSVAVAVVWRLPHSG
jgi:hypothetical protein